MPMTAAAAAAAAAAKRTLSPGALPMPMRHICRTCISCATYASHILAARVALLLASSAPCLCGRRKRRSSSASASSSTASLPCPSPSSVLWLPGSSVPTDIPLPSRVLRLPPKKRLPCSIVGCLELWSAGSPCVVAEPRRRVTPIRASSVPTPCVVGSTTVLRINEFSGVSLLRKELWLCLSRP